MSTQHTATPWRVEHSSVGECEHYLLGANSTEVIAWLRSTQPHSAEDRAFIVRACNSHDALLAALRETFAALEDSESLSSDEFFRLRAQFRNVITQAEGR